MNRTVEELMKDGRYNDKFITVECMGKTESFDKSEHDKLLRMWGKEEVKSYYMINCWELLINIA